MPYINALLHLVWTTKYRQPILKKEQREKLFTHINENAKSKSIHIDCINGHLEHFHCVISLSASQTISKTLQLIKGESARWFNKENLSNEKLEWQDDYFAESVSASALPRLREYIFNQEAHHQKKSFLEEYNELMRANGFVPDADSHEKNLLRYFFLS